MENSNRSNKIDRRDIGRKGETLALEFLQKKGYKLITRNYHTRDGEIDLIAAIDDVLVFIEVRYRKNSDIRTILESINHRKQQKLIKAASKYLTENSYIGKVRFDVVAVNHTGNDFMVEHLENAFYG